MKNRILCIVVFTMLGLSLWSCNDCSFESDNLQTVRVRFTDNAGDFIDTSFFAVRGVGISDSLYETGQSEITFLLPLHLGETGSSFIFQSESETDTITFTYSRKFDVVAPDCGVDESINDLTISSTTYSNAEVLHSSLKNFNDYDVEIRP